MTFASYTNIISPLGFSTSENYRQVCHSVSGISKITLPFSDQVFCVAKMNDDLIAQRFSAIGNADQFTKLEQLSILSIQDVMNQSGINPKDSRTLLIYSTTKGNIDILEKTYKKIDPKRAYLPALANQLKTYFQLAHTPVVLSNACVSGILGIVIARRFIEQGLFDQVLVCGGDLLSEFTVSGFKSFGALSYEPCKPYDVNRSGINLGEAVSTILLTNKKELATPYDTEVVSGASANDANHISGPSRTGEGLLQCLQQLGLKQASAIGFISAHGTATQFNDEMESIAFERAELSHIPVHSLKGYYGHTLGAAGVLETVISLEALKNQHLTKSLGYEIKGVSGNMKVIESHQPASFSSFIKTGSGFGGCNTAALFTKL